MLNGGRALSVVIAGGGTGGHLYPGIAVARELLRRRPDARVTFVGTARGLESRLVPREGFELDVIRSAGLKGKSIGALARGAALLPVSVVDAWRTLSRRRPSLVLGVGGYSSGPVVLLAALRGIPTMVLEQNAVPGLTNRWLAPWVRAAAVTYDETRAFFRGKAIVTGNPVRPEFLTAASPGTSATLGPRLLVLGGSQGAHAINVAVAEAAPALFASHPGLTLLHQTGTRDLDMVAAAYARADVAATAVAFVDGVAGEMAKADLVIARAGATTLAELAACGKPAVLIPCPAAADDHQRKNARVLEAAGAAATIDERDLTPAALTGVVTRLLGDRDARDRMSAAMRPFARPDAATRIVDRILELAR